jgi:hypothetical protein
MFEFKDVLILRSGVFAASRRMEACCPSWFETAQERLLTMRALKQGRGPTVVVGSAPSESKENVEGFGGLGDGGSC